LPGPGDNAVVPLNSLFGVPTPDPFVTYHQTTCLYYAVNLAVDKRSGKYAAISVRSSRALAGLKTAKGRTVWQAPPDSLEGNGIWAPEMSFLDGNWYVYFAIAPIDQPEARRMHVLKGHGEDAGAATFEYVGQLRSASDKWAIDGTVLTIPATSSGAALDRYFIWSGWPGDHDGEQRLYIERMESPVKLKGARVEISRPDQPWERIDCGADDNGRVRPALNEGPTAMVDEDRGLIHLFYSANGSWGEHCCVGRLTAALDSNLMDRRSWNKSDGPVLASDPSRGIFGPGHPHAYVDHVGGRKLAFHAAVRNGQDYWGVQGDIRFAFETGIELTDGHPVVELPYALYP